MHQKEQVGIAERNAGQTRAQVGRRVAKHREAEELIEENKISRALVDYLAQKAVPLHGLLRAQRSLREHLPPQLWVERIEVGGGARSSRNAPPTITIDGVGKELNGVEVNDVYRDFYGRFRRDLEAAGATVTLETPPSTGSTLQYKIRVQFGEESN